jgi:hypothetical protein
LAENLKTVYQVGKGMPDPEPAAVQEGDEAQAAEQDETAEVTPSLDEGEQEAAPLETEDSPESESKIEALASSEAPSTVDPLGRADEREPVRLRDGESKPESSAARRRWAGFTS